jgi:hypothetical protein
VHLNEILPDGVDDAVLGCTPVGDNASVAVGRRGAALEAIDTGSLADEHRQCVDVSTTT